MWNKLPLEAKQAQSIFMLEIASNKIFDVNNQVIS